MQAEYCFVPALLMLVLATVAIAQNAMPARPCLVGMLGQGNTLLFDYPSQLFVVAMALATAAAVLGALEVLALVPVWRSRWKPWPKLRYTLAVLLLAATVVAMWQWNLVGMRL